MADISTSLAGIELRSPIGLASISPSCFWYPAGPIDGGLMDWYKRMVDGGLGYIVTQSFGWTPKKPPMRDWQARIQYVSLGPKGEYSYYLSASEGLLGGIDEGLVLVDALKKTFPKDVPIIASIVNATNNPEEYRENAKKAEAAGADMLEINAGCPCRIMTEPGRVPVPGESYGMMLGSSPQLIEPIVQAIVEAVKIPVGVKLTPQAGYPGMCLVAEAVKRAGAKYFLTTHAPLSLLPPDIHNEGRPRWPVWKEVDANPPSALGGGIAIRGHSYFWTSTLNRFFPDMDICGGGGIVTGENAVETMMLGARAIQVCAAVLWHGARQVRRMNKFLSDYMDRHGYKSIEDFRSMHQKYVAKSANEAVEDLKPLSLVSITDDSKCNGCGVCADTMCSARFMEDGIPKVIAEDCSLCGLCEMICPEGAVSFGPCDITFGERILKGP